MKKIIPALMLAAVLMAGCNGKKQAVVSCDVDPDEVFGAHYTAADFQIWPMDDDKIHEFVSELSVSDNKVSWIWNHTMLSFPNTDTAKVGALARDFCTLRCTGDTVCRYCWMPAADSDYSNIIMVCGTQPLIDGTAVTTAHVAMENGMPVVIFEFAEEHHADWQRITRDNIGNILPIMLGNRLLVAPVVNGEIAGGRCSVMGNLTEEECCALATILLDGNLDRQLPAGTM